MRCSIVLGILLSCIYYSNTSYATWSGPNQVVGGPWGTEVGQFGFEVTDISDNFPKNFYVDKDNNIIIADTVNRRVQVFMQNGDKFTFSNNDNVGWNNYEWPSDQAGIYDNLFVNSGIDKYQYYDYQGNLVSQFNRNNTALHKVMPDGSLIVLNYDTNVYYKYTINGDILDSYTTIPLELGVIQTINTGRNRYKILVRYNDITNVIYTNKPYSNIAVDKNKNMYAIDEIVLTQQDGLEFTSYTVHKFNKCGKEISIFELPKTQYKPLSEEQLDAPTAIPIPIIEYGEPIITENGNIYCWARSENQFNILNWTWVDDPILLTCPQACPDAPTKLKISNANENPTLSWAASPQDPGCITGYEIYRSDNPDGTFGRITTVNKGIYTYIDTTAQAGITYYYKVRALSETLYSPYTNVVSGVKIPAGCSDLRN